MKFFRKHVFTLFALLLIATLSLMPSQEFPQVNVRFADKWAHWVMYGFLTLVMGTEMILAETKDKKKGKVKKTGGKAFGQFLLITVFSCFFGGLMELGQAYLTTSRHGDWLDVVANSFGAFCAFVLLLLFRLVFKR